MGWVLGGVVGCWLLVVDGRLWLEYMAVCFYFLNTAYMLY